MPYLACYDELAGAVENCQRWDQGADALEIVQNILIGYEQYYVFNNFQRDRVGFDSFKVLARTASRYFLPLSNMYQHWLWGALVTGYSNRNLPRGRLAALATEQGFRKLQQTLAVPRDGAHVLVPERNEYVPADGDCPDVVSDSLAPAGEPGSFVSRPSCITIRRGEGRAYFSLFDASSADGLERTVEVGHFYDQMAALIALTNSSSQVVGVGSDVAADTRRFRIPYNLVFGDVLSELYSAVYTGNDAAYAARALALPDGSALIVHRDEVLPSVPADVAETLPLIAPGRSKTAQVQALVAGMTMLDASLNASFAQRGQISLAGSGEQRDVPSGFETVEAINPLTGRVFIAYRQVGGENGPWYAAQLLERAQHIATDPNSTITDIEDIFGDVELVRRAAEIFSN